MGTGAGAAGAPREGLAGACSGTGAGLGIVSGAWPTDWMVEAASCVQTTGLGLPVVAVAVSASRTTIAAASRNGATRHGLARPIDADAYRGREAGGLTRSSAAFNRHANTGLNGSCSVLIRTRVLFRRQRRSGVK